MKKMLLFLPIIAFLATIFTSQSCNKQLPEDQLPAACDTLMISYNSGIKEIMDGSCAYSGCHINGDAPGDFSTYQGMLPSLEDGSIFNRAITEEGNNAKQMPPSYAPLGFPTSLTEGQLDMLHCWIADNYPEN